MMTNRPVREPFFSPIKQFVNTNAEGLDDVINTLVNDINAVVNAIAQGAVPAPTPSTLGGVFSSNAPAGEFANGIDTGGNVLYATPANSATIAQGGSLYVDQFGTFHDFVHDDGAPIQTALNAASAAGGGQVILGPHAYWASTAVTVPPNVQLCFTSPPEKQVSSPYDYTSVPGSIYLTPNNTLTVSGALVNVRIFQDNIHFAGNPTTGHGLQTIISNWTTTGTGVTTGAQDATIRSCTICGFNIGLQLGNFQRPILDDVLIDAINGVNVGAIGDVGKGAKIEVWPFYSANRGFDMYFMTVSGVADNGSGVPRVTLSAAPTEPLVTGDEVFLHDVLGFLGANGKHSGITVIDTTHFDLTGTPTAPTPTGTTTVNLTYVSGISSLAGLWEGMGITGTNIPASTVITKVWRQAGALTLSNAATGSGSVTLTCSNTTFSGAQSPQALYYTDTRHGIGIEFGNGAAGLQFDNVFVHDHDISIKYDNGSFENFISGLILDAAALKWDVTRVGLYFDTNTYGNKAIVNYISSNGTAIYSKTARGAGLENVVISAHFSGIIASLAEVTSGPLILLSANSSEGNATPGVAYNSDIVQNTGGTLRVSGGSVLPSSGFYSNALLNGNYSVDGATIWGGSNSKPLIPNWVSSIVSINAISNIVGLGPNYEWQYKPGTTDNKVFQVLTSNGTSLVFRKVNDAGSSAMNLMTFNTSGIATGNVQMNQPVLLQSYTVATLPTGMKGMIAYVTDAAAVPVYNATAAGGGTVGLMVQFNGTNWVNA